MIMDSAVRLRRFSFRAWHRGTREADYLVGGFFDRYGATWSAEELDWFELLLDEQDVDILDWALGRTQPAITLQLQRLARCRGP